MNELRESARGVRHLSPAFAAYLLAVALIPFRWLSPIGSLYEHADWTDILVGVAAVQEPADRERPRRGGVAVGW